MFTIYKATNKINNKSYIGFDSNYPNRQRIHKSASKKQDYKFYRAIRKYDWSNFFWEIIFQSEDKDYTLQKEKDFIIEYDTYSNGYNSTFGGEGVFGLVLSDRSKQKIRKGNQIPKPQTKEHIEKRIDSMKKYYENHEWPMTGKKHSEETKQKISLSQKNIPKSTEHKKNMMYHQNNSKQVECPHCHKIGQYTNMKRWHFDNCKNQSQSDL
jgi:group I intron endonuclease